MAMLAVSYVDGWLREMKDNLQAKRTRQQREETFREQTEKLQHKAKVRIEPVMDKKRAE
jgi:S-DNA-T family DNA segregation ATPase FtsK/SpoIIIE